MLVKNFAWIGLAILFVIALGLLYWLNKVHDKKGYGSIIWLNNEWRMIDYEKDDGYVW